MQKTTLSNGLEVYLDERPNFGEAEIDLVVESGSFHERIPQTAHVLEHLQAVKSKVYGNSDKLNYASSNAETQEQTQVYYFEDVLPEHLIIAAENLEEVLTKPNLHVIEREKKAVEKITSEDIKKAAQFLVGKPYIIAIGLPLEQ